MVDFATYNDWLGIVDTLRTLNYLNSIDFEITILKEINQPTV